MGILDERAEVFRGANGRWYIRHVSANGSRREVNLAYRRAWTAKRGARRIFPGIAVVRVVN